MTNERSGLHRIVAVALLGVLLGSVGALFDVSAVSAGESDEVVITVQGLSYSPESLAIETGTTVIWRNAEIFDYPVVDGTHRAVATDGSFDTGDIAPGQQFARAFLKPGRISYECVIHPGLMDGAVEVTGEEIKEVQDISINIVEPSQTETSTWGFDPSQVSVSVGTTVTWRNNGSQGHTVTAEDGSFDSENLAPGKTFVMTFDKASAFRYKCTPHPWMTGTLSVAAAGQAPPPPPPPASGPKGRPVAPPVQQDRGEDGGPVTLAVQIVEPSISDPQGWGFTPKALNARAGDTVVWTNTGSVAHTATASDGSFDSGDLASGKAFQRTLDKVGTFNFACKPHPWMTGTVVVAAAGAPRPVTEPGDGGAPGVGSGDGLGGEKTPTVDGDQVKSADQGSRNTLAWTFGGWLLVLNLAFGASWAGARRKELKEAAPAATEIPSVAPDDLIVSPVGTREMAGSGAR